MKSLARPQSWEATLGDMRHQYATATVLQAAKQHGGFGLLNWATSTQFWTDWKTVINYFKATAAFTPPVVPAVRPHRNSNPHLACETRPTTHKYKSYR